MKLVIVESPGKTKKIASFLGSEYKVEASFGHVRDLNPKELSIDIENNFKPTYLVSVDKKKVVKKLKDISAKCDQVILAADLDREGEAIAQSLKEVLKLKNPIRIVFNEVTKTAVLDAINKPGVINQGMVEAQQTRRLLDRIMGYKISPLLWKHLPGTKSAGRVQSVLVRILVEHENKINDTASDMRIKVIGDFNVKSKSINSVLFQKKDIKYFDKIEDTVVLFKKLSTKDYFYISQVNKSKANRNPSPPFITSTLQQDASAKIRFSPKKTMMVAQKLYEAGYITYMRTDSTILSKDALQSCQNYILEKFGKEYYKSRQFKSKSKNAQEAHEAIRPTKIKVDILPNNYDNDAKKLYSLIWNRTVASQMSPVEMEHQKIKIKSNNKSWSDLYFQTTLSKIIFDGFLKVYRDTDENDENDKFIGVKENDKVDLKQLLASEEFKPLPPRMNEAGLIKYLEKKEIGRPSTYASLISKVLERDYIEIKNIDGHKKKIKLIVLNDKLNIKEQNKEIVVGSEKNKLVPTELGIRCNNFLVEHFDKILNEGFTAYLENQLDEISNCKLNWLDVMKDFYQNLKPILEKLDLKPVVNLAIKDEIYLTLSDKTLVYTGKSKFGKYLRILENEQWKYASLPKSTTKKLSEEQILELFKYPKLLGKNGNSLIHLCKGEYGYYLKMGKLTQSIKDDPEKMNLEEAIVKFNNPPDTNLIKTIKNKNKIIYLKKGTYGKYFQTTVRNKKVNIKAPKNVEDMSSEEIIQFIKNKK